MNTTRKTLTGAVLAMAAAVALVLGASGPVTAAPVDTNVATTTTTTPQPAFLGDEVAVSGGVIRLTDTGPEWHINTRHTTAGFDTTVEPTINSKGDIEVQMLQTLDVISATVDEDETLSAKGVWAGGSSGVGNLKISLRKTGASNIPLDLNDASDYSMVRGEYSNLWITVLSVAGTE